MWGFHFRCKDVRAGGRIEHLAINVCLAPVLSGLLCLLISSSPRVEINRVVYSIGG